MKRASIVVGILLSVAGIAAILLDVRSLPMVSGLSLIVIIGLVGIFAGTLGVRARMLGQESHATLPNVELPPDVPVPGDRFDEFLVEYGTETYLRRATNPDRERVRSVLQTRVISTLVYDAGYTRTDAERAVRRGDWTDDAKVAAFLGGGAAPPSLSERLRSKTGAPSPTRHLVSRTISEIRRIRRTRP